MNNMQIDPVKEYLTSSVKTPYFLFISDVQYVAVMSELSVLGLDFVSMSRFCSGDDKLPDIDGLLTYIETADVNAKEKKFVVTGLGEYLALRGNDEASSTMSRLKDHNIGGAKVILLLRGLASQITGLQADPRFDNRRFNIVDKAECDLSFILAAPSIGLSALSGFKTVLVELESGRSGSVVVNTAVNLDKSIFTIHQICNAYEGIKFSTLGFTLAYSCGNDTRWTELLMELNQSNGLLNNVFAKHGFDNNVESNFYARISGSDYHNWLYFICLKSKTDILHNEYLSFVLNKTNCFEEFAANILNSIIEIQHTDKRFSTFYRERKVLVEKFPESDIADFVVNNRQVVSESIYKLTDNTRAEREEIIVWISQNGVIKQLEKIYPMFAAYLKKYVFKCPELSDMLTEYFEAYKRQKLSNNLEVDFLKKVDELAHSPRKFNYLSTRNEIIDSLDKTDIYLYWLDALGVEYLSLIEALVQKRGLSVRVNIARAELPTITSINRNFFDAWQGHKEKNDELDDTKHKDAGGYNFMNNELPVHLAKEIDIIAAVIDKAATELAFRHCKRFLIVSDHGASRLAVLRRKEEKYNTDTTGEHSGRCCKVFQPYDLPFAAEENGYLVLADYGRFKGSRAANVEVHGGASMEEVVIPVIELSLKNGNVTVKLLDDDAVNVDYRTGTEIKLFFNSPVQEVSVVLNGKSYSASQIDENHYSVKLFDTKRAGNYPADVYAGDNLIGKIMIKAQGRSGKVNDAFDDLFLGIFVTYLPVDSNGCVSATDVKAALRPDTKLVSIMLANNEIGTIQPILEIGKILNKRKVLFHTDAVQAMGHISVNVNDLQVDFMTASAHKFNGAKGTGFLYMRTGLALPRLIFGGEQEHGQRAGTENVAGIVALGCALEESMSMLDYERESQRTLVQTTIDGLRTAIPDIRINAENAERLPGTLNVTFPYVSGESMMHLLDLKGICVSTSSACNAGKDEPSHVLLALGLSEQQAKASIRISYGRYNTADEVEKIVSGIIGVYQKILESTQ